MRKSYNTLNLDPEVYQELKEVRDGRTFSETIRRMITALKTTSKGNK